MNPSDLTNTEASKDFSRAKEALDRGDGTKAVEILRSILATQPGEPNASVALGIILGSVGQFKESVTILMDSAAKYPNVAQTHYNLGVSVIGLGDVDWAMSCYQKAVELDPTYVDAFLNIATIHQTQGRIEEALKMYDHILETHPDFHQAWNNRAYCLLTKGNPEAALESVEKAIELSPEFGDALNMRAIILQNMGRLDEALEAYDYALRITPNNPPMMRNRANCLDALGRFEEALETFKLAKKEAPQAPESYIDVAVCEQRLGKHAAALKTLEEGAKACPSSAEIRFRLSAAHLMEGNFAEGWKEYDARFWTNDFGEKYLGNDRWDGTLPIRGNTLVVRAEQGYGDTIQYSRLLPFLKNLGVHVVFECQPGLKNLLSNIEGFDEIVERSQNNVPTPFPGAPQMPLLSLPGYLGIELDTVPCGIPYITPGANAVNRWAARISELASAHPNTVKVGIAWAGRAEHKADRFRSSTFEAFTKLAGIDGVLFFNLQKGDPSGQAAESPTDMPFINIAAEINDFTDTAAIIENLDLVISVDTSIVHLAGALGKPVWNLVTNDPDARWMMGRTDSPWYPTMQLFRQKKYLDWTTPINAVRKELAKFAKAPVKWQIEQANAHHESGKPGAKTAAKAALLEIARRNPRNIDAINTLGALCWADGDIETAISAFTEAVTIDPNDETSVANCADAMLAIGQVDVAAHLCKDYLEFNPKSADIRAVLERCSPVAAAA
jgi:tetratricopeptide (TPR) repeat protein